jgi:hypothetical protein
MAILAFCERLFVDGYSTRVGYIWLFSFLTFLLCVQLPKNLFVRKVVTNLFLSPKSNKKMAAEFLVLIHKGPIFKETWPFPSACQLLLRSTSLHPLEALVYKAYFLYCGKEYKDLHSCNVVGPGPDLDSGFGFIKAKMPPCKKMKKFHVVAGELSQHLVSFFLST